PVAISVLLPALYIPIIAMLMGLIFRGVAVEFRERAPTRRQRHLWDAGFLGGSVLAAFCQGALLGAVMQGIKIAPGPFGGRFGGYPFSWLSWFSVYTGIALVFGYGLLGATWLIWRTEGDLQNRMRRWAAILCVVQIAFMVGVSFWTPFLNHHYMHRWFTWPAAIVTTLAPFGVLGAVALFYFFLWKRKDNPKYDMMPFLCAGALFVIAYAGVGFSLYPIILPPSLTIWNASSPPMTEEFILIGDAIFIPILLGYNTFAWWIFRGKARDEPFGD
ncbi:MAG TPA: cytochrome d ubiquinol oxidase subunit II, partial [Acetobacteraceae bacterium]|nr:cytochrome d ubiquinol oxidase subunit II [Acetobacteraceae bacterium]